MFGLCNSMQATDKPVAVGFGISKPEHVKQVLHLTKRMLPIMSLKLYACLLFDNFFLLLLIIVCTDSWMGS